jgi:hypothetical protein
MREPDPDLRSAFQALGRDVRATGPAFADVASKDALQAARARRRRQRGMWLAAAVVVPVIIALQFRSRDAIDYRAFTAATGIDLGAVSWTAPSDFLLTMPGDDLLEVVPSIDIHVPALPSDSSRPPDSHATPRRSSD